MDPDTREQMAATGLSGMNLSDMPHTRKEEIGEDEEWDGMLRGAGTKREELQ